jgi:Tol biopolymer transport system component
MDTNYSFLTQVTAAQREDAWPAWSPDGARLAFVSDRDSNREIYLANADGTGQTRLTNDPNPDLSPEWSPDGSRLAFVRYRSGRRDIYVMNVDGSGLVRLTNDEIPAARGIEQ